MGDELKFEEPPAAASGSGGGRPSRHPAIARKLRKQAREWAVIGTYSKPGTAGSVAYNVRNAVLRAYAPAGAFEAVSRSASGEHRVYARYVGEAEHA